MGAQPGLGTEGKNCFNPYGESGSFDTKLAGMVKQCTGGGNLGCYSLAYAVKRKHTRPENTFDNIVDYHIERGCQNDMPKFFPTAQSKETWSEVKLNFPTSSNGGVLAPGGQSFDYLTCFKENRME